MKDLAIIITKISLLVATATIQGHVRRIDKIEAKYHVKEAEIKFKDKK